MLAAPCTLSTRAFKTLSLFAEGLLRELLVIDAIIESANALMDKSIAAFEVELAKVRTGRAHPSLLDHIKVNCYDSEMPIAQMATVSVADGRTLAITPWDKAIIPKIERALITAEMGLNPSTAGTVIRVTLPSLTEERRGEFVKLVRALAEDARVAVRNIRREANANIKTLLKDKDIAEDDERSAQVKVQKLTDQMIESINARLLKKEAELTTV